MRAFVEHPRSRVRPITSPPANASLAWAKRLGHSPRPEGSSDQRVSEWTFDESFNGVDFRATASDVEPTAEFPDGFRWVQTVIPNDPLKGVGPESVDGAASRTAPRIVPFDIRTYGFTLSRFHGVGKVNLRGPEAEWSALPKQREIVSKAFPDWEFSMLKGRALVSRYSFLPQI